MIHFPFLGASPSLGQNEKAHANTVHGACNFKHLAEARLSSTPRLMSSEPSATTRDDSVHSGATSSCCFICFETEGVMLSNVCACTWSRVHPTCLSRLVKGQQQASPNPQQAHPVVTCRVCNQPYAEVAVSDRTPLLELNEILNLLWKKQPNAMTSYVVASVFMSVLGVWLCIRSTSEGSKYDHGQSGEAESSPDAPPTSSMEMPMLFVGLIAFIVGMVAHRAVMTPEFDDGQVLGHLCSTARRACCRLASSCLCGLQRNRGSPAQAQQALERTATATASGRAGGARVVSTV